MGLCLMVNLYILFIEILTQVILKTQCKMSLNLTGTVHMDKQYVGHKYFRSGTISSVDLCVHLQTFVEHSIFLNGHHYAKIFL